MAENVALIGADPEVFVQSLIKDSRGRAVKWETVPAFGLFGGNKEKPNPMEGLETGFFFLEDNAALEFNIPPQSTGKGFAEAIKTAKDWMAANLLGPKNLEYADGMILELQPKYQKDPRGKEVGCMADFDAYDNEGAQRQPFNAESLGNTRYAGAHIHLSYNVEIVPPFVAARFLDLYLSLPWIEYDHQHKRRQTYGKAGLFRPKAYGVEYRTLSNWWVWMPERHQELIANAALKFARNTYEEGFLKSMSDAYTGMPWQDVKSCIESEDHRAAMQLMDLADRQFNLGIRNRRR